MAYSGTQFKTYSDMSISNAHDGHAQSVGDRDAIGGVVHAFLGR